MLRHIHSVSFRTSLLAALTTAALGCLGQSVDGDVANADSAAISAACASAPVWKEGVAYTAGSFVQFQGKAYKVIQSHTSLAGWTPAAVPALFQEVGDCGSGATSTSTASSTSATSGAGGASSTSSTSTTSGAGGSTGTGGAGGGTTGTGGKRVVGYFMEWGIYGRNFQVSNIHAEKLTHINYAFANVSSAGECVLGDSYADIDKAFPGDTWDTGVLRGNFNQLIQLKKAHPGLKTLISVGGWTWSTNIFAAAATDASRAKFASSCVAFASKYGFDGIDIDWEYPGGGGNDAGLGGPQDAHNYTLLLKALRAGLDAQGKKDGHTYELTIAAPAAPSKVATLEVSQMSAYLDAINVMTYDFHGGWENSANFNAPLYASKGDPSPGEIATKFNADSAIKAWLSGGAPAKKVVMGVPFYGRGWAGVPATNNGLFQSATGPSKGTWENGILDYKDIKNNYLGTFTRYFSNDAKVPWLYNAQQGVMISYDDPDSMKTKAQYINTNNLGGAMIWELSGDDDQASLLTSLVSNLKK